MTPEEQSLLSKITLIVTILILLLIMGGCLYFIYGYISPASGQYNPPTPIPTATPTPTPTPKPTATATPLPTTSVAPTHVQDPGSIQQDTRVTNGFFSYSYPGIWGNYIIYDMSDGQTNASVLYDTTTRQEKQIATGTVFSYGDISNGKVMLYNPLNHKIILYDIAASRSDLTSMQDDLPRGSITMYDTKLAYYQDNGHMDPIEKQWVPNYCIYVFSMIDGSTSSALTNLPQPYDIRIYGDRLVWMTRNGQYSDIWYVDLSTVKYTPKKISTQEANNNHPRIYDNTIVYHSDMGGEDHVYMYTISTGQTRKIAQAGQQWSADIYKNYIVYDDNRDGNWNIYLYDMNSNTETRLTNEMHDQKSPVINGNRIAYYDNRDGGWNIYTMTIPGI